MTTPFWLNDPTILLNKNELYQIWPNTEMSLEQKLNSISRLVIILSLFGYLITQSQKIAITGIITLAVIVFLYYIQKQKETKKKLVQSVKEGFTNPELYKKLRNNYTTPTTENPLMNVLQSDYKYNVNRKPAAPAYNSEVEKEINTAAKAMISDNFNDSDINKKLFRNLGDNLEFDQSMRSFYATANTIIPNDQKAFAEYCYGDMVSCKEGNEFACDRNQNQWRWTNT